MNRVSTPEVISEQNKRLILKLLRTKGPMSRADISRISGMSFPTVSSNVRSLIESNYVLEVGAADNSHGRKAMLVAFHAERGFIVGVDIGRFCLRVMLSDLVGTSLTSARVSTSTLQNGEDNISLVLSLIKQVVESGGKKNSDILCVSIGIPGIIVNGQIRLAPYFYTFSEDALRSAVAKAYPNAQILLENCVNLGAIGEKWRGAGVGCNHFVYLSYGIGIGAAFILDGVLYKGPQGAAGEIGFMLPSSANMLDAYEGSGALEQELTGKKISQRLSHNAFQYDLAALLTDYERGDAAATEILTGIGTQLSMLLINLSAVLNPELIIISGGVGVNVGRLFVQKWEELLAKHVPFPPRLAFSSLENEETLLGAIAVATRAIHQTEPR